MLKAKHAALLLAAIFAACSTPHTGAPRATRPSARAAPVQYPWRGISVDVARHFFAPSTLRRAIDLAAHYRLNVVHLHLTDNEAWRLPSTRYPMLPSSAHYTRAQLRSLVSYARRRGIVLMPEVDLPAHAGAAIRAYPRLACGSSDTLCPERAATFASGALAEVLALFPSPFVHTGGDEVEHWRLADRRTFERAIDSQLRRAHRTMVVWDDEADAAPSDAIVEVWHLGDAAARARGAGHKLVVAFDGPLYFNAVQGDAAQEPPGSRYMTTLEQVYAFRVPRYALGAEAVVWSEHIADEAQLWYMLLPRMAAFSAVAGDARSDKPPWPQFRDRTLPRELRWLTRNGYTFRIPNTLIDVDETGVDMGVSRVMRTPLWHLLRAGR